MTPNLIVIDNFYENPDSIRAQALSYRFDFVAHWPGMRTYGVPEEQSLDLKSKFEKILNQKIIKWDTFDGDSKKDMNTCYQLCLKEDYTWVHHDKTKWAAVCYLTPNADPDSGTGLFTHIEKNISAWDPTDPYTDLNKDNETYDLSKWRLTAEVKNQYNRLILYSGYNYHRSMVPGFGNNYLTGRLTQVFFFDT